MSILTQLFKGQITFSQAATQIETWGANIISKDATLKTAVTAVVSDVKQGASNAIDMADSALGQYIQPATAATEAALEGALSAITKGASLPFNPLITDGIDTIANAVKAEADAWALKTKASLTVPATSGVNTPPPAPAAAPQPQPTAQ
jgi:hypothetical protein